MKFALIHPSRVAVSLALTSAGLLLASGLAQADTPPVQTEVFSQSSAQPASREQVQADFLVWQAAGMQKWSREGADLDSQAYRQDLANYLAVRASPQFALVQSAIERGQMPVVKVAQNPLRLSVATN